MIRELVVTLEHLVRHRHGRRQDMGILLGGRIVTDTLPSPACSGAGFLYHDIEICLSVVAVREVYQAHALYATDTTHDAQRVRSLLLHDARHERASDACSILHASKGC